MKRLLLLSLITCLPALADARSPSSFAPMPEPACGQAPPDASDAELAKQAHCNLRFVIVQAYNDNRGDLAKTMDQCAGTMKTLLGSRRDPTTYRFVCAQEASTMPLPGI